jgi:hypothetical protein
LTSLQTYAPGDLTTGADVFITAAWLAEDKNFEMPEDQTVVGLS